MCWKAWRDYGVPNPQGFQSRKQRTSTSAQAKLVGVDG